MLPHIIYGTAWKAENTTKLVVRAINCGFRAIDVANQPKHYNEQGVGKALSLLSASVSRDEIFLQSKFTPLSGHDPARIPYSPTASLKEQVTTSFEGSLRNLETSFLDAYLLHSPMKTLEETIEVWKVCEGFIKEGKVKYLGISNCYSLHFLSQLYSQVSIKPSILQNRFIEEFHYDEEIRSFCRQNRIMYQSFWTLTGNQSLLENSQFAKIAEMRGISREQLMFRLVYDLGIVPLTGTTDERHMKMDLLVDDMPCLGDKEKSTLLDLMGIQD